MAKRITAEDRIIAFFMGATVEQAGTMLRTAAAIVKQRTPQQQRAVKKPVGKPRVTMTAMRAADPRVPVPGEGHTA